LKDSIIVFLKTMAVVLILCASTWMGFHYLGPIDTYEPHPPKKTNYEFELSASENEPHLILCSNGEYMDFVWMVNSSESTQQATFNITIERIGSSIDPVGIEFDMVWPPIYTDPNTTERLPIININSTGIPDIWFKHINDTHQGFVYNLITTNPGTYTLEMQINLNRSTIERMGHHHISSFSMNIKHPFDLNYWVGNDYSSMSFLIDKFIEVN